MTASFLASFLIYMITGVYVLLFVGLEFTVSLSVKVFVFIALLGNACFYFYYAAFTEMDPTVKKALEDKSRWEWYIRVLNQALLFSLWFGLQFGWRYFGIILVSVYVTYLLWDLLTWGCFNDHTLVYLDAMGLVDSIAFLWLGAKISGLSNNSTYSNVYFFFWGVTALMYLVIVVIGIGKCKFNPFQKITGLSASLS